MTFSLNTNKYIYLEIEHDIHFNLKSLTTSENFKMISPHIQRSYIDMRERKQPIATILHVVVKKNAEVHRKNHAFVCRLHFPE